MNKSSENYWAERIEQLTIANIRTGDATVKELERFYSQYADEVKEGLELYYARYSTDDVIKFQELLKKADKRQLQALWEDWDLFVEHHPQYSELKPIRQSFYQFTRLDALNSDIHLKLLQLQEEEQRLVQECLEETAKQTSKRIEKALAGINIDTSKMTALNNDMIKQFLSLKWTQEENFSERIWSNNKKLVNYIQTTIKDSIIRGQSYKQTAKLMDLKFETGIKNAMRLVHTESAFIQEEATFNSYEQCGVTKYRYMAMMDSRTSDVCRSLDGKIFDVKDARPGLNRAPMHPNCRSTSVPEPPKR